MPVYNYYYYVENIALIFPSLMVETKQGIQPFLPMIYDCNPFKNRFFFLFNHNFLYCIFS